MQDLHLFTELIAWPPNVICSKCYDFEGPMNSSSHFFFIKLSTIFVMTIILSFSDTALLSSVMIYCYF
jgi:hypothetical protein